MFFTIRHLIGNMKKAEQTDELITKAERTDPGQVDELTITVLDEYYADGEGFMTENGISYLLGFDDERGLLFDVGFNRQGSEPSPLLNNMNKLGITTEDFDTLVISHNHLDHVGGLKNQLKKKFSISPKPLDLSHVTAFTPIPLSHPSAFITVNKELTKIRPGVMLSPPIPASLFWLGWTLEQSLSINVKGLGQVIVVGCGHPGLLNIVEYFERAIDVPVAAVVGGFHQMFQTPPHKDEGAKAVTLAKVLGTERHPLDPTSKDDVEQLAHELKKRGVKWIGISPHDNCDGAIEVFQSEFEANFLTLAVGKKITFSPEGIATA